MAGCFYVGGDQYEDVLRRPSSEWSTRDCLTVILSAMRNNLSDNGTDIRVFATPFYPKVILAMNRRSQLLKSRSDEQFHADVDTLLAVQAGVYMDWQNERLVDSRGFYIDTETQFDSLLFLVTLRNNGWPASMPDISDIENRIFLWNEQGERLVPRYVWGRRRSKLEMEEVLLVMFCLRLRNEHQFLEHSENYRLTVHGFDRPVDLSFAISQFR